MINHSLTMSASHVVRLYLWDMLTRHMDKTWTPVANLSDMPIIPTQEQPEEQTSGKPYMVYTYDYTTTSDLWQLQGETLYLRILTQSAATVAATTKLLMRIFNRLDESARDINAWIHNGGLDKYATGSEYDDWMDEAKNFQFKFTRVVGATGAQPAEQEAGRMDAIVSIELRYVELDHAGNKLNLANDNEPFA